MPSIQLYFDDDVQSARRSSFASIHGNSDVTSGSSDSSDGVIDDEDDGLPVNLPSTERRKAICDGKVRNTNNSVIMAV